MLKNLLIICALSLIIACEESSIKKVESKREEEPPQISTPTLSPTPSTNPAQPDAQNPPNTISSSFLSYLGGSQEEQLRDVKIASDGNIYIVGSTKSPAFPTTLGAYDRTHNGAEDCYIAIFDPTGKKILHSTFYGSSSFQRAYNIEIGPGGRVYISGRSGAGLPMTSGTIQPSFSGAPDVGNDGVTDAFIAVFSPDLSTLLWATYWGTLSGTGAVDDYTRIIRGMALDASGNVYIASGHHGGRYSPQIESVLLNAPKPGVRNGLFAKISNDGTRVEWVRFAGDTMQSDIQVDPINGSVTYANLSRTPGERTSTNAYSRTVIGDMDAYVVTVGNDGVFASGTYIGGSGKEFNEKNFLALSPKGEPIIVFGTHSTDLPVQNQSYDKTFNGIGQSGTGDRTNYNGDIAVVKLSTDLSQVLNSTYLGGSVGDGPEGIAVGSDGTIFVSGGTYSKDFPTTSNAYQSALSGSFGGGNVDAFLTKLSKDFDYLLYSTYIGGNSMDYVRTVSIHPNGNYVLAAGQTSSLNLKIQNAFQSSLGGSLDGFFLGLSQ